MSGLKNGRIRPRTILVHAGFWLLYVLSEYIANLPHLGEGEHLLFIRTTLWSLPVLMIPTYLITLYAVPKFLIPRRFVVFGLIILAAAALTLLGRLKFTELINFIDHDYHFSMPVSKIWKNVIRDYSVIALATCIYIIGDWRKKEKQTRRLMEAKAKSDLEFLKQQLHPHFLFNTLNNIYSLALKNLEPANQTVQSILRLSRLMEYLVYQSSEEQVALVQEIELVKNYVDLEILRYGKELNVQLEVDSVNEDLRVAPLVLLPFVENCFKHGGKNENGIFWIKINVLTSDNRLVIHVSNSKPNRDKRHNTNGVGLRNISERLDLLYPEKHKLNIEEGKDFYAASLEINCL